MKFIINKLFSLTIGFFKKSEIQTPNSPPTLNITQEQLNEAQNLFNRGEFIKSGEICYPRKYPMRSADDLNSEYWKFDFTPEQFNLNLKGQSDIHDIFDVDVLSLNIENMLNQIEQLDIQDNMKVPCINESTIWQDIFDNLHVLSIDYSTILQLIDTITNLISHLYFWF